MGIVLIESFLATIVMITVAFYRFAKDTMFRQWSVGWNLYLIGALLYSVHYPIGVLVSDLLAVPLAVLGTMIITFELQISVAPDYKRKVYSYSFLLAFLWTLIALLGQFPFALVYLPLAGILPFGCYVSGKQLLFLDLTPRAPIYSTLVGLIITAASSVFIPFIYIIHIETAISAIHLTGLIMIGVSMYAMLFRYLTQQIRSQYDVSKLLTRVIQHDIRNYIQIIGNAVQLAIDNPGHSDYWLRMADQSIKQAARFVEDMRSIEIMISHGRPTLVSLRLVDLVTTVADRIRREYDIDGESLRINISEETEVFTNKLAEEVFWNIIDNAFKHGSTDIEIDQLDFSPKTYCVIRIQDSAGGLTEEQLSYINSGESMDNHPVPSGLGLGLIRGLAPLCGITLTVENGENSKGKNGTAFLLQFRCRPTD